MHEYKMHSKGQKYALNSLLSTKLAKYFMYICCKGEISMKLCDLANVLQF